MAYDPNQDPFTAMGGGVRVGGNWVPKNHPLAAQAAPAPAPPPAPGTSTQPIATQTQAAQTPVQAGAQVQPGQQTSIAGAFQQALVNKLAPGPLTRNDPQVAPALAANRLSEQRGAERARQTLAEQAAASGTSNSGGFNTQALGIEQDRAGREGQFAGNAMMQLGQQRSNDISNALAMASGLLSDQERFGLQRELADLDAQLRREGLGVQQQLGQGDLALRGELGRGGLNLGLLQQMLGNQQFGQNLGAQLGMFNANLNQSALLNLLGGL